MNKIFKFIICKSDNGYGDTIEDRSDEDYDEVTYYMTTASNQTASSIMDAIYYFYYKCLNPNSPAWDAMPWREKIEKAVQKFLEYSKTNFCSDLRLIDEKDVPAQANIESENWAMGSDPVAEDADYFFLDDDE